MTDLWVMLEAHHNTHFSPLFKGDSNRPNFSVKNPRERPGPGFEHPTAEWIPSMICPLVSPALWSFRIASAALYRGSCVVSAECKHPTLARSRTTDPMCPVSAQTGQEKASTGPARSPTPPFLRFLPKFLPGSSPVEVCLPSRRKARSRNRRKGKSVKFTTEERRGGLHPTEPLPYENPKRVWVNKRVRDDLETQGEGMQRPKKIPSGTVHPDPTLSSGKKSPTREHPVSQTETKVPGNTVSLKGKAAAALRPLAAASNLDLLR
ncbi:hypothetical protein GWK47_052479 [Chionoecetes opilio]|uniref:Uncharacterized protein n=1 Tax=Chionoecetes opilio TaxID=41210 RepID=A0A8J4Y701_CHIOP|nr:hypothetical protein GWK47_052479 [Chionoecetes opilio]